MSIPGSNQFTIDFVTIGNPGNSNDTTGYGGVPYSYRIGKYTISQNQVNAALVNGLQNVYSDTIHDAIRLVGTYAGPACSISWFDAAAFVNWLNTSSGYAPDPCESTHHRGAAPYPSLPARLPMRTMTERSVRVIWL